MLRANRFRKKIITDENIVCTRCVNVGIIDEGFLRAVRKLCGNLTTDSTVMSDLFISKRFRFGELIHMQNFKCISDFVVNERFNVTINC